MLPRVNSGEASKPNESEPRDRKSARKAARLAFRKKTVRTPDDHQPATTDPTPASAEPVVLQQDVVHVGSCHWSPAPSLSPSTSHPFINNALTRLSIPGLLDVEQLCKWVALHSTSNIRSHTSNEWIDEVQFWWGKILWDWAMEEPLVFYMQLQLVLDKQLNLLGVDHNQHSAAAYSQLLALLRHRLGHNRSLGRLVPVAVTGLAYMSLRNGDNEVAEMHIKAVPNVLGDFKSDCQVWLYAYWMELRIAGGSFRRPFLERYIPESWPAQDTITPKQMIDARDLALRSTRAFGVLLGPRLHSFFAVFQALHSANFLQNDHPDSLTRQMQIMYNASYDACHLHVDVLCNLETTQDASALLLELVAVVMKLSVWNVAWLVGPQSGNVQRSLLNRAKLLSDRIEAFEGSVVNVATRLNINLRAILWVFLTTTAEAYTFQPQSRPYWLNQLRHVAKLLQLKTKLNFTRALQNFPCTAQRYTQRVTRTWDDLDLTPAWSRWRVVGGSAEVVEPRAKVAEYLTSLDFQITPE